MRDILGVVARRCPGDEVNAVGARVQPVRRSGVKQLFPDVHGASVNSQPCLEGHGQRQRDLLPHGPLALRRRRVKGFWHESPVLNLHEVTIT